MMIADKKRKLIRRFAIGYASLLSLPLLALVFSLSQGAGWKPILVGAPAFLTLMIAATYQLTKELRTLKREEDEQNTQPLNGGGGK
jgi:hypothetical protein